jgi:heme/copper-type cytochrome/quinol oxidase subunit 2
MNPDVFITIVFSSFVFLIGVAGALFVTVTVVRGRRRADESLSPPLEGAEAHSPHPVAAPSRRPLGSEQRSVGRVARS